MNSSSESKFLLAAAVIFCLLGQAVIMADAPPGITTTNAQREFKIEKRYLNIPIKNDAPLRQVTTLVDGRVEVQNGMELADGDPDFWVFMDVSAWHGKTVTLRVDQLPVDSKGLSSIEQGDDIKDAANLYHEPLRGQFHFSPRRGWMNDPNGLVFFNGEYHLFFQHNPYGLPWGKHWGHAVSRDLVHWMELWEALAPDEMGGMSSGSAVVDWNNSSGFGEANKPPLVLVYSCSHTSVECLASSTDGRVFTKYSGNPIIKKVAPISRDPKVFWHEPTKKWVMVVYCGFPDPTIKKNKHQPPTRDLFQFLSSKNLKDWTVMSKIDGFWEVPDFFPLAVDGDPTTVKWVLSGGSPENGPGNWGHSLYMVGNFDGTTFTPETPQIPTHYGKGVYASQTFNDIPAKDGRRIEMGWFWTQTPKMPFNQSMTLPHELKLTSTAAGPRLTYAPVKELESLRVKTHRFDGLTLAPDSSNPLAGVKAELVELQAEIEPGDATEVIFDVRGAMIIYDVKKEELVVDGQRAPAPLRNGKQRLTIFCDRIGLEVFASDGLTYIPKPFQPKAGNLTLGVQTKMGRAKINTLQVYELKSAWGAQ